MPEKRKGRLSRRVAQALELPPEAVGGSSSITVFIGDREEMTVSDCRRILCYEPGQIRLLLRCGEAVVRGESLELYTCGGGGVTLRGRLQSVEFF